MIALVIKGLLFAALLIYAVYTDIKKREIDNWVCVCILIISLIANAGSFTGLVLTALPFFIPALIKGGSIGGGDVKLMGSCGAVLGVGGGVLQIIIGLTIASVYGLSVLITKGCKAYKKTAIPLAPFLCVGGVLSFIITNIGGI